MTPEQLEAFNDEMEKIAAGFMANVGKRIAHRVVNSQTIQAGKAFLKNPMQEIKHGMGMTFKNPHNGKYSLIARDEVGKAKKFDTAMRGLFLYGAGSEAAGALPREDPMKQGRSRAERMGRFAAGTAVGFGTMRTLGTGWSGMIPSMALGMGGAALGGYAGRKLHAAMGGAQQTPATSRQVVPSQAASQVASQAAQFQNAPAQVRKRIKKVR